MTQGQSLRLTSITVQYSSCQNDEFIFSDDLILSDSLRFPQWGSISTTQILHDSHKYFFSIFSICRLQVLPGCHGHVSCFVTWSFPGVAYNIARIYGDVLCWVGMWRLYVIYHGLYEYEFWSLLHYNIREVIRLYIFGYGVAWGLVV